MYHTITTPHGLYCVCERPHCRSQGGHTAGRPLLQCSTYRDRAHELVIAVMVVIAMTVVIIMVVMMVVVVMSIAYRVCGNS